MEEPLKPTHELGLCDAELRLGGGGAFEGFDEAVEFFAALPNIAQEFNEPNLGNLSWILNGYAIVYAALLVLFGRLAERYPRNTSFLAGIAVFTAASAARSRS